MALRALVVLLLLAVTGCGSLPDPPVLVGTAGVTVDGQGRPVVVLARCDERPLEVAVHAAVDHEASPDLENPLLASWTQVSPGPVERLELREPGPDWQPGAGIDLPEGEVIVSVSVVDTDDDILAGLSFTRAQLEGVDPDEVLTNDGVLASADLRPDCD